MNLYWEYTATHRYHWISDGKIYNKPIRNKRTYEFMRWAIVNCTARNNYNQVYKEGYDLYHKGKIIQHAKTVKELKEHVKKHEERFGNKITYGGI